MKRRTPCLTALLVLAMPSMAAPPVDAEYAYRWPVSATWTAAAAADKLQFPARKDRECEVTYFNVQPPDDAPEGTNTILRARKCTEYKKDGEKTKTEHELTLKYRGEAPIDNRKCPDGVKEAKYELDVAVLSTDPPQQRYSASCIWKSKDKPVPLPAGLKSDGVRCAASMVRWKAADDLKLEEWTNARQEKVVEVSWTLANSDESLTGFRSRIAPLVQAGLVSQAMSKACGD